MDATTNAVTGAGIKRAIETRDGRALTNFYADDAVLQIVDRNNPPSKPREVKGKTAIGTFWDDICSRAMTHRSNQRRDAPPRIPSGMRLSRWAGCCAALCGAQGPRLRASNAVQAGTSRGTS